ncbi:MAG TPA: carbon-nitrogen hydrolase family protein [Thermoleophilaceae bacterium]|nr:carbon-nitrogen hydrolase family protein [Thermoleophilaceae bacterium]
MRALSVAALQTSPEFGDPEATLRRVRERVSRVREVVPHVQLVMLPELHLAALPPPLEPHRSLSELAVDVPGPLTEELAEIARAAGIWLVPGSVFERGEEGRVHNTALVLSPEGELVASYRKVFPWQPHEPSEPGDRFVTFDIPEVGRLGLSICYDGSFPETCRELAWMGAEVVLQVSLTTTSDRAQELVMTRANAIFNQLYVVSLNAGSPAGLGRSLIVDPEGLVRLQAGDGDELITDVLDLDAVTRVREYGTAGVSRLWDQATRTGVCARQPRESDGAGE